MGILAEEIIEEAKELREKENTLTIKKLKDTNKGLGNMPVVIVDGILYVPSDEWVTNENDIDRIEFKEKIT